MKWGESIHCEEPPVGLERVDEHARLGLEAQDDVAVGRVPQHGAERFGQAFEGLLVARVVAKDARPERDAVAFEESGGIDRPAEEIDPNLAIRGRGGDERRLVLDARIEQEACAGFDRRCAGSCRRSKSFNSCRLARQPSANGLSGP